MKILLIILLLLIVTAQADAKELKMQPLAFSLSVEENVTVDNSTTYYRASTGLWIAAVVEDNNNLSSVTFKNKDGKYAEKILREYKGSHCEEIK